MSLARPLFWRKSDGHPQDGDEGKWVADGLAGRYSADKQRDGTWLLWWAHDNFVWEACATFAEVKQKAEADWQTRFAAVTLATPANGEQVERAKEVAHRIVCEFRPAGWPAKEDEIARLLMRTFPTPTEDARSRVKVLEGALRPFAAVAEHMSGRNGIVIGYDHTNVTYEHFRRARTALGNEETDRHG